MLVLVGMKCTKVGGTEIANARVTFTGGMNYFIGGTVQCHSVISEWTVLKNLLKKVNVAVVSGMCAMVAFSYYGHKIVSEFKDPFYKEQK